MRTLMLVVGCASALAWTVAGSALAIDETGTETTAAPAETAPAAPAETEAVPPAAPAPEGTTPDAMAPSSEMPESASDSDDSAADGSLEEMPAAPDPAAEPEPIVLGEIGYDAEGREGRIHVVRIGDTLWDISDAYLGTPWVWPSIWTDNREIENPHRIYPGDHIWITDSEMRVITPEEAAAMLAASPPGSESPAAPSMDDFADGGVSPEVGDVAPEQPTRRVSTREWVGLVSAEDLDAAASIVEKIGESQMLAQMNDVYIGLGEGDVEVGDKFDIVRREQKVKDPESGRSLGWYVMVLGWLEVTDVHPESSRARIRMSNEDIREGDLLLPHRPESMDIAVQPSPEDVEGVIAFFPRNRVVIGQLDFVYLNRGSLDGLESGSPLEVVRGGDTVSEPVRRSRVEIPRRVVAELLVVEAQEETAVALVSKSETDLLVGDTFRGLSY